MELSLTMKGIISQRLLKTADGKGLLPATEIMIATPSIRKLLSEGKTGQILGFIQDGEHYGMQSFNQALVKLYKDGKITFEEAMDHATSPDEFKLNIQGIYSGVQSKDMV
jgi:Tfp pilus assembly pilus retraction ATPase PilT